eukprot:scaffold120_cov59-Cylindrotheca_fusiformis.AAC.17
MVEVGQDPNGFHPSAVDDDDKSLLATTASFGTLTETCGTTTSTVSISRLKGSGNLSVPPRRLWHPVRISDCYAEYFRSRDCLCRLDSKYSDAVRSHSSYIRPAQTFFVHGLWP